MTDSPIEPPTLEASASSTPGPVMPEVQPLPDNITSVQPGGGVIVHLELKWGELRRQLLKSLFPSYVIEMKSRLKGDPTTCPVEVIDSRDLKYYRNVSNCYFEPKDDPFAWRSGIPFARAGFMELVLLGVLPAILALILFVRGWFWTPLLPAAMAAFVFYFFRDPHRLVPKGDELVLSPADGTIVAIETVEDETFVEGKAIRIGIFLSVFNCHVNRMPRAGKVVGMYYQPGKYINAMFEKSREENERLDLYAVEPTAPHRKMVVRQIAGLIARRIICEAKPGEVFSAGHRYGMIKFGSRTELILPAEGLEVAVRVGDKVNGGNTVLGRYQAS